MSSENAVPQQKNNRPGSRLQRAREDRGWSVPQTAEKLHVIPRYVRAIEEGDYSQLPGLVFLKGYVRSYARLVNLSEDRLIEDLEQELLVTSDPMLAQPVASTVPAGFDNEKSGSNIKLFVLLIIIGLAVGGGYFLWEANKAGPDAAKVTSPSEPTATQPTEKSSATAPATESNDAGAAEISAVTEPNIETQADKDAAFTENEAVSPEAVPIEPEPAPVETVGAVPEKPVIETSVAPEVDATEAEAIDAPVDNSGQVELEGLVSVKAIFTSDCWFDLRDRDNNRTVGLYRAGDVVDFSGYFPLRFVVGAVDAVSISVAGKPLDFSKYRVRNNRVELVLEQ